MDETTPLSPPIGLAPPRRRRRKKEPAIEWAGGRSPIEEKFEAALVSAARAAIDDTRMAADYFVAKRQERIGRASVDFYCTYFDIKLAIECDGHDFHERTKEQASRDRARDRALQAEGIAVFRFTGSDIHWDADACAQECIEFLIAREQEEANRDIDFWEDGKAAGLKEAAMGRPLLKPGDW